MLLSPPGWLSMAWRVNSYVEAPIFGWILMRASSRRLATTLTSSAFVEASVRSAVAPSASGTVTMAVAVSKPSFSPTTA